MNIKDNELRGIVLKIYYDKRRDGRFQWNDSDFMDIDDKIEFDSVDLYRICDQLGENNLINWHPVKIRGRTNGGIGEITAYGVDVIEGNQDAPILININQNNVNISNSTNFQVGNSNVQEIAININKIIMKINESDALENDKKEAKSILKQFIEHPVVASIIGGLASTIQF